MQEFRAERTMETLRNMASPTAQILRESLPTYIAARDLVPGDIILLKQGDNIPADARVVESVSMEVDESLLTGESLPILKE